MLSSEENFDKPEPPDDFMSLEDDDDDNNSTDCMSLVDGNNTSTSDEEFLELDPSGRYGRYAELLGRGATKTVYKAYDMVDCKEVAWNKAKAGTHAEGPVEEALAIEREIIFLQKLNCKGIIKLYSAWVDEMSGDTNFITELCSMNLLNFRLKHKNVSWKVVKSWARQILESLVYLHTQDPPIIHRDLKCENLFVKSRSSTTLKVGDFGSATILDDTHHMHTVVGTPEFMMAPEIFQQDYNELVDVYSFGMCILELVTQECPYSECTSLAQVYKHVIGGKKPKSLLKVKDAQALQFINRCLMPAHKRPSAKELLDDPFLHHKKGVSANCVNPSSAMPSLRSFSASVPGKLLFSDGVAAKAAPQCVAIKEDRVNGCSSTGSNPRLDKADDVSKDVACIVNGNMSQEAGSTGLYTKVNTTDLVSKDAACVNGSAPQAAPPSCRSKEDRKINGKVSPTTLVSTTMDATNGLGKGAASSRGYQVVGTKENENTLRLRIRIEDASHSSNIVFPFDLRSDTAQSVAEEMVHALHYPESDLVTLADLISEELAVLASISEDGLVAPTCSEKQSKGLIQQIGNSLIHVASPASSGSCPAFVESNTPYEETTSGIEKGCFDTAASGEKSKRVLHDNRSAILICDAGSCVSTITDESFEESALPLSSELRCCPELFLKCAASSSCDEKRGSELAKRHGKSLNNEPHNRRLHLFAFKNFKQLPKFPWRPPCEQGWRPLYVNTLA